MQFKDVATCVVGTVMLALVGCGAESDGNDSTAGGVAGVPGATGAPGAAPGTQGPADTTAGMDGSPAQPINTMNGSGAPTDTPAAMGASGAAAPVPDGTGGNAGSDTPAMGDDDGMMTDTGTAEDQGVGDGSDVITIGDSYMLLLLSGVRTYLETISGQDYRNYEFPGTRVLDGNIPGQYAAAKAENPDIKTVIMTGGGNDVIQDPVMQSNCEALNQACLDHMDVIGDAIEDLMMQMHSDGVRDVVVVGYSYMTGADLDASLDHSRARYRETCKSDGSGTIPIRCHFVDPLELGPPLPIAFDGIHPTEAGYETLAGYTWDRMQAEGVRR